MTYENMLGSEVPRRGNKFFQWLGEWVLGLMGWRVVGEFPNVRKAVVIGAPHTSNWDGVVGVSTVLALRLRISLMGKSSLFRGPFGPLLRWIGLIPIDRTSAAGIVEQSVEKFNEKDQLFLGIAPEGTRHGAPEWKTGFYRIALEAGVPIMLAMFDYENRILHLPLTFHPTGDMDADMERILHCYRGVQPKRPERLSGPLR
ncbi:MAG: lysophospholipid acyltransferase family protein [Alcanivoracaceae bacterium]|nr:lysophospholipid acyltransferase family protein [Alcanivoracaceae bacterium]